MKTLQEDTDSNINVKNVNEDPSKRMKTWTTAGRSTLIERITKLNTYSLLIHTTALIHTAYTTLCPDLRLLRLHRRVGIYWYRAQGRRGHPPVGEGAP